MRKLALAVLLAVVACASADNFRSLSGGALLNFASSEVPAQQLTNVQKLSLPTNTAVGTQVIVTDRFVVSGTGTAADGSWVENYYEIGDPPFRETYQYVGLPITGDNAIYWRNDISEWRIVRDGLVLYKSTDDVDEVLEVTTWQVGDDNDPGAPLPTLVHPVTQQLAAAVTAQGGVVVLGGTQDGVYAVIADSTQDGRSIYRLLGASADVNASMCTWTTAAGKWRIYDGSNVVIYYSLSDVATPDLATGWLNASDDTPASIAITSVSVGEINAGLFVSNDGATNGSSYVSQPFHGRQYYMGLNGGGSNNMHWDTDYNVWTDDVGVWTADNVAFPWQGTDNHTGHNGASFIRNDIANEANWQTVP